MTETGISCDERDAIMADLGRLLGVLGLGDHARPQSPHEVFQQAIDALGRADRFPLDMAQVICPQCSADAYPDSLGEALGWALRHRCSQEGKP